MNARITFLIVFNAALIHIPSFSTSHTQKKIEACSKIFSLYQNMHAEDIANAMKKEPGVWYQLMLYDAYAKEQEKNARLIDILHMIAKDNHDIVQQIFTCYVEDERIALDIKVLESFTKFGAQPEEKASTSKETPLEILEARYGVTPKKIIVGVKCLECNSWNSFFRWFFNIGYNTECTTLKESIQTLKQQQKSKKLTKAT